MIATVSAILGVTGALLSLAIALWRTERRAGDFQARATSAEAQATSYATQLADMTNERNTEKARAEKLDARLQKFIVAAATTGVDGLFKQLLLDVQAADADHGDGAPELHHAASAHAPGPDDLLDPARD